MSTRFDLVTIDSPDTERLTLFWCAVLSLHEIEREDGDRWIVLGDMDGTRRIGLQRGDHRPGGVHLDLVCDVTEFDTERRRLLQLGATAIGAAREGPYGRIANLADPDGNLFDLCAYEPST